MCGICGLINTDGSNVNNDILKRMTRILSHRGPDGEGIYSEGSVGLGHRRLSIIDLSDNARQPMTNEDGSIVLVFNGMIYNYREITDELKAKGHIFKSRSDTEAIVHLYEEMGPECVRDLRGMFAFAIWDIERRELILARDRIGQKPLVYATSGKHFLFASEPKSILASGVIDTETDVVSFHSLFSYKTVPYPRTMFKNIEKLPPATVMVYKDGIIKTKKYWRPLFCEKSGLTIDGAVERLENLIDESVKLRLIADVPVGAFLSGGVDSSIITVNIHRNTPNRLKAFSVGFEKEGFPDPEFRYAESVAKRYNLEHRKILINESILEEIENVVWYYDEPFPVPEALVNMKFCREIKKEVTTALTGDGSDELFGGYSGYYLWKLLGDADILLKNNPPARQLISILGALVPAQLFKVLLLPPAEKRAYVKRMHAGMITGLLYSKKFMETVRDADVGAPLKELYVEESPSHLLDGVLYMDLLLNDAHGVCVFSDISGMANGLEIRSPFLDHNIVEFASRLPVWMKVNGAQRKYILKRLARSLLPEDVLTRKKLGYGEGIPLRKWFSKQWRPDVERSLFGGDWNVSGLIDEAKLRCLWELHLAGRSDHFDILWTLFCYSIWHKVFFKEFNGQLRRYGIS